MTLFLKGKAKANAKNPKRKFDLAELATHYQAVLEILIEKKLITSDDYEAKLSQVRDRSGLK